MAEQGLTKGKIDAAKPAMHKGRPTSKLLFDRKVIGFGLRVSAGGTKTYFVQYRQGSGRGAPKRRYTIGKHGSPWTVDTARQAALRILGRVVEGANPADERKLDPTQTVRRLAERFLEIHVAKKKPRTVQTYRALIERLIQPELATVRVPDLTAVHVGTLHYQLRRTRVTANRTVTLLSKMLAWGHRNGFPLPGDNPCRGLERYAERPRERFLRPNELTRLGDALTAADSDPANLYQVAAVRLLIFTGARMTEILTLRWTWIDLNNGVIRLPDSKTGAKTIHLSAPARAVLDGLPRVSGNPHVIVGGKTGAHLVNLEKPWRRIRKAAGLDDVRLHDLRHSFASVGAGTGMGLPMIGKLLGHSQPQTTARYAHLDHDPVTAANEAIGRRIAAAMAGKPAAQGRKASAGAEIAPG
jgi:integrase